MYLNMTPGCLGQFALQFLIKIIEIWPTAAMGHFLFNSLYQINEIWDLVAKIHFLYYSLPISLKYDLWLLWAISCTIPYQNHWNMTPGCSGSFPSQFSIKSMKYETWLLSAISSTIPYQHHRNMTYNCYGLFPLQLLIKIIEIWYPAARGNPGPKWQFPLHFLTNIV